MEVEESTEVELWCLQELDFADVDLFDISKITSEIVEYGVRFVGGRCLGWLSQSHDR